jgi:hypothetical protein
VVTPGFIDLPAHGQSIPAARIRNGRFRAPNGNDQTFVHGNCRWQVATQIGVKRFLASARSALPASGRTIGGAPLLIPQNSGAAAFAFSSLVPPIR